MSAGVAELRALLIAHGAPVRRLDLELMARRAFPATTPIALASTPAEAYIALTAQPIAVALLEESLDFIAFAQHAARQRPGLVIGWVRDGAPGRPPLIGERLNSPIVLADLADLAARAQAVQTDD